MPPIRRLIILVLALVLCPLAANAQREKLPPDDYDFVMKKWPDAKISNTGIRDIVEKQGNGGLLMPGDMVMVNYTGQLLNGKVFDQNHDKSKPFTFRLARGEVIAGWDQVLQMMKPGDKWLVIIPPELAYGRRGSPPTIPSYATLTFDVEIVGVKREN